MTSDGRQWLCTESKTPLMRIDADGAKCGNSCHWHPRRGNGFAGARPIPPIVYTEIPPAEPTPIAAGRTDETPP